MLGPIDDETAAGLYLNRDRATYRRAHEIATALQIMAGGATPDYLAALTDDDAAAAREFERYQAHQYLDQL